MEEFDELLPTADADGRLDLSHRAWEDVDEVVWTMGNEVRSLSVSYNRLRGFAADVLNLKLLRDLDCSCNKIEVLPVLPRQLVRLKCNGNVLVGLPELQGDLEELYCSENRLVTLPRCLGKLQRLRVLHVQNNELEMLPPTLADIDLQDINCANNPKLDMVPRKLRDDTKLVRWVLGIHRDNERECQALLTYSDKVTRLTEAAVQRGARLKAELQRLDEERLNLIRNAPTGLDRVALVCKHACSVS